MSDNHDRLMKFMFKDELICEVWYNRTSNRVHFKNHTTNSLILPFGKRDQNEILTFDDLYRNLEEFVFPETRRNCKEILTKLGLDFYDRYEIVRKTHGVMINSSCWIKFDDDPEELCWDTISKV